MATPRHPVSSSCGRKTCGDQAASTKSAVQHACRIQAGKPAHLRPVFGIHRSDDDGAALGGERQFVGVGGGVRERDRQVPVHVERRIQCPVGSEAGDAEVGQPQD